MRVCTKCSVEKPFAEFPKCRTYKDGIKPLCTPCNREYQNKWRASRPGIGKVYQRKHNYGITEPEYQQLLERQNNSCAVCEDEMTPPQVDHCHTSGKVRGLLCKPCNLALGLFKDRANSLLRAAEYLGRN